MTTTDRAVRLAAIRQAIEDAGITRWRVSTSLTEQFDGSGWFIAYLGPDIEEDGTVRQYWIETDRVSSLADAEHVPSVAALLADIPALLPWLLAELDRQDAYIAALIRMVEQLDLPGGARITFATDGTAHVTWPGERGEVQA